MIMHNDGNNRRWFLFKGKLTPQNDNEILIHKSQEPRLQFT